MDQYFFHTEIKERFWEKEKEIEAEREIREQEKDRKRQRDQRERDREIIVVDFHVLLLWFNILERTYNYNIKIIHDIIIIYLAVPSVTRLSFFSCCHEFILSTSSSV